MLSLGRKRGLFREKGRKGEEKEGEMGVGGKRGLWGWRWHPNGGDTKRNHRWGLLPRAGFTVQSGIHFTPIKCFSEETVPAVSQKRFMCQIQRPTVAYKHILKGNQEKRRYFSSCPDYSFFCFQFFNLYFSFLRRRLKRDVRLALNLLSSQGWPWTADPPASIPQAWELQVYTTTVRVNLYLRVQTNKHLYIEEGKNVPNCYCHPNPAIAGDES